MGVRQKRAFILSDLSSDDKNPNVFEATDFVNYEWENGCNISTMAIHSAGSCESLISLYSLLREKESHLYAHILT